MFHTHVKINTQYRTLLVLRTILTQKCTPRTPSVCGASSSTSSCVWFNWYFLNYVMLSTLKPTSLVFNMVGVKKRRAAFGVHYSPRYVCVCVRACGAVLYTVQYSTYTIVSIIHAIRRREVAGAVVGRFSAYGDVAPSILVYKPRAWQAAYWRSTCGGGANGPPSMGHVRFQAEHHLPLPRCVSSVSNPRWVAKL